MLVFITIILDNYPLLNITKYFSSVIINYNHHNTRKITIEYFTIENNNIVLFVLSLTMFHASERTWSFITMVSLTARCK